MAKLGKRSPTVSCWNSTSKKCQPRQELLHNNSDAASNCQQSSAKNAKNKKLNWCSTYAHNPEQIHLGSLLHSCCFLNMLFWKSAITSIAKPIAHTASPRLSTTFQLWDASGFLNEKKFDAWTGIVVMNTQIPCMCQKVKNLNLLLLMRSKRLSFPTC